MTSSWRKSAAKRSPTTGDGFSCTAWRCTGRHIWLPAGFPRVRRLRGLGPGDRTRPAAATDVAFSPRPRVRHVYDGDLGHIRAHLLTFGRGEIRFRNDVPEELAARYLDLTAEWEDRLEHTRSGARRALRSASPCAIQAPCDRHCATSPSPLLGPRASDPGRPCRRASGGAGCAVQRAIQRTRTDRFNDFWRLTARRGRLDGLAESRRDRADPPMTDRIDLTESLSGRAIGFHEPEPVEDGPPIRWTTALALIRVCVPGDRRCAGPPRAAAHWRGLRRRVPRGHGSPSMIVSVSTTVSDDAIDFEIGPGLHWLTIACTPLRPRRHGVNDHRHDRARRCGR